MHIFYNRLYSSNWLTEFYSIGIMVHNIPEGIAIAIPCLAARPDQPWLSFVLASVSGLAEPMGAFVALLFLRDIKGNGLESRPILNLENILSFVAGIMVMVAFWEQFPEANLSGSPPQILHMRIIQDYQN